jgi:hypothetical protein
METTVEIDGKTLIIRLSLQKPVRSKSTGKTLVIASTHGTVPTEARLKGKQVSINVNAFVYPNRRTQPE